MNLAVFVDIFKTLLMGCGALAILGMVGCAGLVGIGSYAIDQELARQDSVGAGAGRSTRPKTATDPFSDYDADQSYDEDGEPVGGWGDGTD